MALTAVQKETILKNLIATIPNRITKWNSSDKKVISLNIELKADELETIQEDDMKIKTDCSVTFKDGTIVSCVNRYFVLVLKGTVIPKSDYCKERVIQSDRLKLIIVDGDIADVKFSNMIIE